MSIHSDIINNIPILKVEGKIESNESQYFIQQVKKLATGESKTVILDLHKTSYLDSAAIGMICSVHIELSKNGRKLEIMVDSSPDSFINQLFEMTGLDKILNLIRAV